MSFLFVQTPMGHFYLFRHPWVILICSDTHGSFLFVQTPMGRSFLFVLNSKGFPILEVALFPFLITRNCKISTCHASQFKTKNENNAWTILIFPLALHPNTGCYEQLKFRHFCYQMWSCVFVKTLIFRKQHNSLNRQKVLDWPTEKPYHIHYKSTIKG